MLKMLFHRHDPNEPCPHMEKLLNAQADGKTGRFARWYVLAHTARCGPCRRFLERLEQMLSKLKSAKSAEPSEDAIERMMSRLEADAPEPRG